MGVCPRRCYGPALVLRICYEITGTEEPFAAATSTRRGGRFLIARLVLTRAYDDMVGAYAAVTAVLLRRLLAPRTTPPRPARPYAISGTDIAHARGILSTGGAARTYGATRSVSGASELLLQQGSSLLSTEVLLPTEIKRKEAAIQVQRCGLLFSVEFASEALESTSSRVLQNPALAWHVRREPPRDPGLPSAKKGARACAAASLRMTAASAQRRRSSRTCKLPSRGTKEAAL
eukprot:3937729-Rhodomonas_salina.1